MLNASCEKYSDDLFITYNEVSLTYQEFYAKVKELKNIYDDFNSVNDFVLVNEKNPIRFYTMLFALWESDKKVVFPNREFFEGKTPSFVRYCISMNSIDENNQHKHVTLPNDDLDTVVFSSGSTGSPKGIVHAKASLINNAKSVLHCLKINGISSVTSLQPYLVSSLCHLLVHMLSGSHLIFIDTEKIANIRSISRRVTSLSYVGSPIMITSMLPNILNDTPHMFFSSGDICYSSVIREVLSRFPQSLFYNVYGMAELGGRLFINKIDRRTDAQLHNSIGKNINNTEVVIDSGEVIVRSSLLFYGYIIDSVFVERREAWFRSGDMVVEKNAHLEFLGRRNDEIKIAGNKISLKYIEKKISEVLPSFYIPIVVSEPHDLLGNMLSLVLYSERDIYPNRTKLIQMLKESLKSHELPHKFYSTDEVIFTQTQKIDRNKVTKSLGKMRLL